jgi:hypothetical protein
MADITVDVNLPSAINVDITSPTQALATNVSIPGPQGPRGEKGNPTSINSLTAENIVITGIDGNVAYTSGTSTIFISGNSGYFQSAVNSLTTNLNNTGANLNTSINSLSGLFTGYTGSLDATYATDSQLNSTGNTLNIKIDNLSGYVNSQDTNLSNNLTSTGSSLQTNINTLSSNLNSTGANLENKITSLSGTLTGNYLTTNVASNTYATISNLNSTGSTLNSSISFLSGTLTSNYATIINLASTGSNLQTQINNLDNVYATDVDITNLNNKIISLSGDAVLEYGNQTIQGQKTFTEDLVVQKSGFFWSGIKIGLNSIIINEESIKIAGDPVVVQSTFTGYTGDVVNTYATISNLVSTGSALETKIGSLSGTLTSNYATITNLASTGSTLVSSINSLNSAFTGFTGNLDTTYATDNQLSSTGTTLVNSISSLSGTLTSTYATITNLASTGSTLNNSINSLSGTLTSTYATINNLASTGSTLQNNISSTGSSLDDKIGSLSGTLTSTYASITNLASTGSTLATNLASTGSTLDTKINSLSGSSVLLYENQSIGGVKTFRDNVYINNLFVTGTETIVSTNNFNVQSPYLILNLTGGAVDGGMFFVTGAGLTGINDSGPIIGFDHSNKFKFGVSTRNSDLSTLPDIASVQDIQAYSGVADGRFSTITNLASTGNTLEQKISSLSGTLTSTYATITNLASTGSTLVSNLASTGSTLQTNINTVSSNLISTGNNLEGKISSLSGTLTSNYATIINLASTGSTLVGSINSLSGTLTSNYATITNLASTGSTLVTNLASTGSTLQTNINNLSNTYATITNLASTGSTLTTNLANTGSTLQTNINNLSNTYATITNLASTGSTLNTRTNNLSGYINSTNSNIVFTTGNQTISGTKTFIQDTTFGDSAQGDFLVISGNNFTVYGSGNFTSGLFVNGSPVLTGSSTLYATTVNLASTGSTLDNQINNLSGVSVLRFGDQTISGVKTFATGVNISGDVGIGTITPFAKLHIAGSPALLNTTMEDLLYLQRPFNAGVAFGSRAVFRLGRYAAFGSSSFTRLDIALRLAADNTGISPPPEVNVMTLRADGRVGIGTTTPSETLTVAGNTNISGNLTVSGSINISGNYNVYSQIENTKKLAIAYAIAL